MMKRMLVQLVIAALMVYVVFGVFLFFGQRQLIYYPDIQSFNDCPGFTDYEKVTFQGTRMYLKRGTENVIVLYHGNAGSACDRSVYEHVLGSAGSSLIFVEYAGYSDDTRSPSQKLILQDVGNVHDFIRSEGFEHVVVVGESIGTGAASYHSMLGGVSGLVLVSPFTSLKSLAQSIYKVYPAGLLVQENYDNVEWLKAYEGSLIVFHGAQDEVIPHRFSRSLYEGLVTADKEYVLIDGMGHNDLWGSSAFTDALKEYVMRMHD